MGSTGGVMINQLGWIPLLAGVFGLLAALLLFAYVVRLPSGQGKVLLIAESIHQGAQVFLRYEYAMLSVFLAVLCGFLYFQAMHWHM